MAAQNSENKFFACRKISFKNIRLRIPELILKTDRDN